MQKKFEVKNEKTLPEILEFISQSLKEMKLNSKEAMHSELICEEALMKLIKNGDFSKRKFIIVNVRKFLGNVSINLQVPGNEFALQLDAGLPFSLSVNDVNDDDEDGEGVSEIIRNLILRSFNNQIKYKHAGNYNIVKITAFRSSYSNLYRIMAALILAVAAGIVMKNFMPEEIAFMINGKFLVPVRTIFLNAFKMCAIPIMFFSMVSCFTQTGGGNLSQIKRAGGKMFSYAMINNIIAVILAFFIVYIFNIGKGITLTASSSSIPSQPVQNSFSIESMMTNLMPSNFIKPFFEGNMLQLIVLAILVGIAAGLAGSKIISSAFNEINKIFMKIMELFLRFMPLLVFCSITSMFLTTGTKTLFLVLEIILTYSAALVLIFFMQYLMVAFISRLNPGIMLKKALPLTITALTTCSSVASIPEGMKTAQKLGIAQKIHSFLIPLGAVVCRSTFCAFICLVTLAIANMYGIDMTSSQLFLVGLYSIILPIIIPGIPGVDIIAVSSILVSIEVPIDGIGIVAAISSIADPLSTALTVISILALTLVIAKSENMLDVEKYYSKD